MDESTILNGLFKISEGIEKQKIFLNISIKTMILFYLMEVSFQLFQNF